MFLTSPLIDQAITLITPVGIPTLMLTIRSMSVMAMLRQLMREALGLIHSDESKSHV